MPRHTYDPDWLKAQRGLTYQKEGSRTKGGFMGKFAVVCKFVQELDAAGKRVTHPQIRQILKGLRRDYTTDAQTISRLLHGVHPGRKREKYPNGHRVQVTDAGRIQIYKSLNEAAKEEGCSPESVRLWAHSRTPNRKGQVWRFIDPRSQRSKRR